MKSIRIHLLLSAVVLLLVGNAFSAQDTVNRVNNIVLVHVAWVDGSGWRGVYDILTKKGYNVGVVQEPETSFQADERWYAERAKCRKIEVAKGACHAVFASRPKQVAALIEAATTSVK